MQAVSSFRYRTCLLALPWLLSWPVAAQAEQHFLANVPAGTSTYAATARIGVDTPSGIDITGEFVFDGIADYYYDVTGDIEIWRSGPLDSFQDPITHVNYGVNGDGLNTLRLEMVKISSVNYYNPAGSTIGSLQLGDGITGGTKNGPLFSTGGAAEIGPNGELANGFLNLFLDVSVLTPLIPIPLAYQGPLNLDPTYLVGPLHNNDVLHLEAVIGKFPPGVSFFQTGGPVGFYAPITNKLVQDLADSPLNRDLKEMKFAQFIFTELRIVPEPGSIVFGLIAAGAFGGMLWHRHRQREISNIKEQIPNNP